MAKKKRETVFRVVNHPEGTGYVVLDKDGKVVCPAAVRAGRTPHEMRAGNWRLLYMDYGTDETGGETGEFWVKEEYAHRLPCW